MELRSRRRSPDVALQRSRADFCTVDIALGICSHAFGCARTRRFLYRIGNEILDRSILRAADSNATLPAVVILRNGFRFGIGGIEHIVFIDEETAWPAELFPLLQELPILVEDFDSIVVPVTDEQPAFRIHRKRVRLIEVAGSSTKLAPGFDELSVFRDFQHTRCCPGHTCVTFGDEDIAVGRHENAIRLEEELRVSAASGL